MCVLNSDNPALIPRIQVNDDSDNESNNKSNIQCLQPDIIQIMIFHKISLHSHALFKMRTIVILHWEEEKNDDNYIVLDHSLETL